MASVPANQVNLSDYGGVPGASSTNIRSAFTQAFSRLKSLGGGTLNVAAGTYNFGSFSSETTAVNVAGLRNVIISAYGAKFTMTTTAQTMPVFFNFDNPNNVSLAGASFYDNGADISVNWKGAVCISVQTSVLCKTFKVVDCSAENVVTFFRTYGDYTMEGFDIHATVKNSYYGINPNFNGRYSRCDLTCVNVRRGFMSYGTQDWDIKISCHGTSGALGSNGFLDLSPDSSTEVRNCTVDMTVSGDCSMWACLIHFYNQSNYGDFTRAYNVKANLNINNVYSGQCAGFRFTFEDPNAGFIDSSTITGWEQIQLTGNVVGSYSGRLIANPSVSTSRNNSIYVASNLAAIQSISGLPSYFKIFTPTTGTSPSPTPTPARAPSPVPGLLAINVSAAVAEGGAAYWLNQDFGTPADTNTSPNQSVLRIFENGVELGPAHSLHGDISDVGRGLFSHWTSGSGQALVFSASDNSDPDLPPVEWTRTTTNEREKLWPRSSIRNTMTTSKLRRFVWLRS